MLITMGKVELYHNGVTHDSNSPLFLQGSSNFTRDNGSFNFSFDGSRERELLRYEGEVDWLQYRRGNTEFAISQLRLKMNRGQLNGVIFHRTVRPEDIETILRNLYWERNKSPSLFVNLNDLHDDAKQEVVRLMNSETRQGILEA